jgi:hypothetical protein
MAGFRPVDPKVLAQVTGWPCDALGPKVGNDQTLNSSRKAETPKSTTTAGQ